MTGSSTPPSNQNPSTHRVAARLTQWLLPLGLLLLGGIGFGVLYRAPEKPKLPPSKPQPIRTKVISLQAQDYTVMVKSQGVVQAHNEITVSAQVPGLIIRLHQAFEVGSYFLEGEVLVELEAHDYKTAVAVAEARTVGAKSALQIASLNHERNVRLAQERLIPDAEVDRTSAIRMQAEADLSSATAQLERTKRDLDRTQIRAPFAGRVRRKSVGLGQSVGAGTPLGIVFAVDSAEVRLPISTREARFLELPERIDERPLAVTLRDAVDAGSETIWNAKIMRTEGALDENSLEIFVIARVDDPFGLKSGQMPLRVGQPVTASIIGKTLTNVVALPRAAVRQLDQILLVDKATMTLRPTTINPLWGDEELIVVRDPAIHEGVLLSMTQLVYAPAGSKVEIIPDIPPDPAVGTKVLNQTKPPNKPREEKLKP